MIVPPAASTTSVPDPTRRRTTAFDPTSRIVPSRPIATAVWPESRSRPENTRPPRITVAARRGRAPRAAPALDEPRAAVAPTAAAAVSTPRRVVGFGGVGTALALRQAFPVLG